MKNYLHKKLFAAFNFKIGLIIIAMLNSFNMYAQVTIKFTIDVTAVGLADGGVHIAGQFATVGSPTITEDWQPAAASSELMPVSEFIYEIVIVFPDSSIGDSLQFLFLRDSVWSNAIGDMSEGNPGEGWLSDLCGEPDGFGGYNRLIAIPECDGQYDAIWNNCSYVAVNYETWFADADFDGYGDWLTTSVTCDGPPPGYVSIGFDCNDADSSIHHDATEICNTIDDNCNGVIDDGLVTFTYFADVDADEFGNNNEFISSCFEASPEGFVADSTDCDDANANIYPGAEELENGVDDNCNNEIDEGFTAIEETAAAAFTIYPNPFVSEITIALSSNTDAAVTLFDITGNIVHSEILHANRASHHLNLSCLNNGMYLYELNINGEITSGKIVKQ